MAEKRKLECSESLEATKQPRLSNFTDEKEVFYIMRLTDEGSDVDRMIIRGSALTEKTRRCLVQCLTDHHTEGVEMADLELLWELFESITYISDPTTVFEPNANGPILHIGYFYSS